MGGVSVPLAKTYLQFGFSCTHHRSIHSNRPDLFMVKKHSTGGAKRKVDKITALRDENKRLRAEIEARLHENRRL